MKNMKRILLTMVAAMLLVVMSVGGTLAYLQSQTAPVNNTFSVGNVKIILDEAKVNEDGEVQGTERVTSNSYKLQPQQSYTKDPTVTVKGNSENSYIRMKVTVTNYTNVKAAFPAEYTAADGTFLLQNLVDWNAAEWPFAGFTLNADDSATYEFRYYTTVDTTEKNADGVYVDQKLEPLFTTITMPGVLTNDDIAKLANTNINIIAEAIQADGFKDAADAWNNWNPANTGAITQ